MSETHQFDCYLLRETDKARQFSKSPNGAAPFWVPRSLTENFSKYPVKPPDKFALCLFELPEWFCVKEGLLLLTFLLVLLTGCSAGPLQARQTVVEAVGTSDVFSAEGYNKVNGWQFIARDTNGAVWMITTDSRGTIDGRTRIFDAPMK